LVIDEDLNYDIISDHKDEAAHRVYSDKEHDENDIIQFSARKKLMKTLILM